MAKNITAASQPDKGTIQEEGHCTLKRQPSVSVMNSKQDGRGKGKKRGDVLEEKVRKRIGYLNEDVEENNSSKNF